MPLYRFSFSLMRGLLFTWMAANFHSSSQPADVLYALVVFLDTHAHLYVCVYTYNLSPLDFSLTKNVLLCLKKKIHQGTSRYLAELSER